MDAQQIVVGSVCILRVQIPHPSLKLFEIGFLLGRVGKTQPFEFCRIDLVDLDGVLLRGSGWKDGGRWE
jgi:hypothetical protein